MWSVLVLNQGSEPYFFTIFGSKRDCSKGTVDWLICRIASANHFASSDLPSSHTRFSPRHTYSRQQNSSQDAQCKRQVQHYVWAVSWQGMFCRILCIFGLRLFFFKLKHAHWTMTWLKLHVQQAFCHLFAHLNNTTHELWVMFKWLPLHVSWSGPGEAFMSSGCQRVERGRDWYNRVKQKRQEGQSEAKHCVWCNRAWQLWMQVTLLCCQIIVWD